jgi:hypothetical protein
LSDVTGYQKTQMSDCTSSNVLPMKLLENLKQKRMEKEVRSDSRGIHN